MPLLGKNHLAITLHMYASIAPNLDNTHRGQIQSSSWRHCTTPNITWPETEKCILPEWLKHFFRTFCTITIQKPFRRNLSMRFGLWWKIKKWERKMCLFDHSFAHNFFVFHFGLLQRSKKVKQRLESATGRRRKNRAKKFWLTGSEFAPG